MSVMEAHKLQQEQPEQYVLVDVRNAEEQKVGSMGQQKAGRGRGADPVGRATLCCLQHCVSLVGST